MASLPPTSPGSRAATAAARSPDAPRPAAAPAGPRLSPSWLAAQGRLPLAFMGVALAWLAGAATLLAWHPELLALPHLAPPVVALTHAWVIGFFVTVATGAMYQLAPVALGTTLWSERTGWWHFGLHAAGSVGLVAAMWQWNLRAIGAAGLLVAAGTAFFAVNALATIVRSGKRDAVAWSLGLATVWLALTVTAGLTLAANRLWSLWPADPLNLLRAHAHLGLAGFFLTLLQGVTFRLIPMFTLGDVPDWRPVRAGLWLSQAGLLILAPSLAVHAGPSTVAGGALIAAGLAATGIALRQTLAARKKRALDPGIRTFVAGMAGLGAGAALGLALAWPSSPWGSAPGGFNATVYGLVVIGGGLVPAIAGMLCKIVPFLTWMRAYGPKVGRMPTPAAGSLSHARWETIAFALQAAALLPLTAGTWLLQPVLLTVGAWLFAAGTGLFLADMISVLKHLWLPATPAAPAPRPSPRFP